MIIDWYGFKAHNLENENVSAIVVPELGGKIVSLFDKKANHEWLAKPTNTPRKRIYADTFIEYELAGWDEMLPTIDACNYPLNQAIHLPDHGEVWTSPMNVELDEANTLQVALNGKALPYHFQRKLILMENKITLDYTLTNPTDEDILYLWAAHPLFNADETTQILLPDDVRQLVNVVPHNKWGDAGEVYSWPTASTKDGDNFKLERVGKPTKKDYRKFYIPPEQHISWAALKQVNSSCTLKLMWSADALPYCGIWIDEGTYTKGTTVAIEPTNAYYDNLERACENHTHGILQAHTSAKWQIILELT